MCALICCAVSFLYFVISFCLLKFSLLWMMYSLCSRKAWLCAQRQQKFSSGRICAGYKTICYYKSMSAAGFRFCFFFSYVLLSFPSYVSDPLYLPLHFPCTSRVSFPVVTVRLPVALDLGQWRMFNHYWSFLGCCLLSIFLFLCTSITR